MTPTASIKYNYDGNLIIDVEKNTTIQSESTMNNTNNSRLSHTLHNESTLIYDINNGNFYQILIFQKI